MGLGPDLRPSYPTLNPSASADDHADIMCEHSDMINNLMVDALEPLDAKHRELTRLGYPLRPSKDYLRFERYETKPRKAYNEALQAFRQTRAEGFEASEPITSLPPDPEPALLPSAPENCLSPESEPEPEPEFEIDSPFEGKPVMAMPVALFESVNTSKSSRPSSVVSLASALPQPSAPLNRKARRAREKAARKRQAIAG